MNASWLIQLIKLSLALFLLSFFECILIVFSYANLGNIKLYMCIWMFTYNVSTSMPDGGDGVLGL